MLLRCNGPVRGIEILDGIMLWIIFELFITLLLAKMQARRLSLSVGVFLLPETTSYGGKKKRKKEKRR